MAFTNSDDVNILQASDGSVVGAGAGNDRYVLSAATLNNSQRITISDTAGLNSLQLVGGLVITSSQVTNNALLLNLNNGAQITVLGANTFNYITGGDPISGAGGTTQNFNDFVTQSLRTSVPPGNTPNSGGSVTVNSNGGTTAGGGNPVQSVTVASAAASFNEGANAVFNVTASNVPNGTTYTFQISGVVAADVVGGSLTGTVVINNGVGVISIPLAADSLTEGAESLVVTLTNTGLANAPSASAVVNDTSTAPTNSRYTLTGGVDTVGTGQTAGDSIGTANLNDLNLNDRIIDDNTGDNDTLNALLTTSIGNTISISNIENLNLNVLAGTSVVDAENYTGIKTLTFSGQGNLTLNNLQSATTLLRMNGTNGALIANYAPTAVVSANDTVTVDLVGTSTGSVAIGAGVETLRLTTTAGQTNTLSSVTGAFTTVQISGGGAVNVIGLAPGADGFPNTAATILATDTSSVNLSLATPMAAGTRVFTGAGADTVRFTGAINTNTLVSLGANADTLILDGAVNAAAMISGVDAIRFTAQNASLAMTNVTGGAALEFQNSGSLTVSDATAGTSIRTTDVLSAGTATGTIDIRYNNTVVNQALNLDLGRNVNAGSTTILNASNVTIGARMTGNQNIGNLVLDNSSNDGSDVTRSVTLDAIGAGTQLTVGTISGLIGGGNNITSLSLLGSGAGSTITSGAFATATALQTLNLNASTGGATLGAISGSTALNSVNISVGAAGLAALAATDISTASAGGINTVSINANGGNIGSNVANNDLHIANSTGGMGTVTITGSGDVYATLTTSGTNARVQTVNAASATGAVDLQITNSVAASAPGTTVSLGAAPTGKTNFVDILGLGADVVNGGAGSDAIATFGGNDTIVAGAGNDTITGGLGGDTITLGGNGNGNDRVQYTIGGGNNDISTGTAVENGDLITGFGLTAGVDQDVIDLAGPLQSAGAAPASIAAAHGVDNVLAGNMLSVGAIANLNADLTNAAYNGAYVVEANTGILGANFTTQGGIDAAVTAITGRVTAGTVNNANFLIVVYDGLLISNAAIFKFTDAGIAGIQANELSLVGVVTGVGASNLTDVHFA